MSEQGKLFIVSNRLPVNYNDEAPAGQRLKASSGGLVTGLREIHEQSDSLWIGFLGQLQGQDPELESYLKEHNLVPVHIRPKVYDKYYNGYANGTLWPLFHNFLASMSISDGHWKSYVEANHAFAKAIIDLLSPGDRIWVHDYQLMLLPQILREHQNDLKISYFHHIPFPSSEIFRAIPRRSELINGLLGADYIGFHTYDYARHFIQSAKRVAGAKTKINEIMFQDRPIKVAAHPLGVDFKAFAKTKSLGTRILERLRDSDRITFLGIDRLDYTKGLPERLKSFARFLELYPHFVGKARLIQICVPSRQNIGSYNKIRSQVERLVGKINGEFSRSDYIPVEYIFRSIPQEEVIELYQQADVMVVTPLRDGLNLVAKEYVAARTDGDGCLVLSEFAGAASEMGEALQVNPYDIETVAHTLNHALEMPPKERRERMQALRKRMKEHDNINWAQNFMAMWSQHEMDTRVNSKHLTKSEQFKLVEKIKNRERIFLFLDYDGTLAPIQDKPELAVPDKALDELMAALAPQSNIISTIVTGRPTSFCEQYLLKYGTHIAAEHGSFIRYSDDKDWEQVITVSAEDANSLQVEIMELLETYQHAVPKSHIEKKETCIVWHYRESEPEFAANQARILGESLEQMLNKTSWSVYHGKKAVEIRQSLAHKGYAVETVLDKFSWNRDDDALLTIGDDTTDEDMHRVHTKFNESIHIGSENAYSKYFLDSPANLYEFINLLIENFNPRYSISGASNDASM
ncbi:bifunctional alpha,alpha-trehalose-phosphate synthase (UDP-forming)/trehalose-phosphatase [Pseudobacteriovorax antillogorgiicola]|uniref:Trehalose 6-phosphate synthase /trehalose 6-phosphatase n=1 Tax=Pseudobacteriovorax antillogorgiicola TaxID=1513793 RepID=A0A1Y6CIB2_9BACT|nr:bifunctional alpha,alpha-trehalose-phosphate synthase (UDP-forming)/trehalose-phosphatase [Pseudobacteriovorax antillogorgiicola]TCS46946.1 trehalose 6-phosphate synthase /trehalose 6-phosphatase [Pseudobacteriovorax antillogorgiicola]SMF64476.1 trehalose 6-phosphate synthase /trehalose 6-phosphatase [Pseudobacteriovorax antillogorgiicola]